MSYLLHTITRVPRWVELANWMGSKQRKILVDQTESGAVREMDTLISMVDELDSEQRFRVLRVCAEMLTRLSR